MLIIEFLQGLLGDRGINFFLIVTDLHSEVSFMLILALYFWLINPDQARQLGLTLVLSLISNILLKDIFSLPRPYIINPDVITPEAVNTTWNHSFPSGHAQGITTFWGTIACLQKKTWVWIVAIAIITLVCLSRIALGVHYPLDVVAGILLAIIWIYLGFWSNRDRAREYFPLLRKIYVFVMLLFIAPSQPQFAPLLGIFAGLHLVSVNNHVVPRNPISKITLGIIGLVAIAILYVALDDFLGSTPDNALIEYIHYWLLTVAITEVVPALWRGSQPVR